MNDAVRISRTMLGELQEKISERDTHILQVIEQHRFLTTCQVTGFCFTDKPTPTAALRAANRALKKLHSLGLLNPLQRRIGGVRAGSGGAIWSITEPGHRLLHHLTHDADPSGVVRRTRFREPSQTFLEHTLAVADVHLTVQRTTAGDPPDGSEVTLAQVELEPACWRPYLGVGGVALTLKPDLAVVTRTEAFEDHWFFEVDRATEPPSRIIRKCLQYQDYYRTGREQHRLGVFPAVVWIVPTLARHAQLTERLRADPTIDPRLFTIATVDQLPELLRDGPPSAHPIT